MQPKQNISQFWAILSRFASVEADDPALKRKGQLLALFIGLCFVLLTNTLINNIIIQLIKPSKENLTYIVQDIFSFIPLAPYFSASW